MQSSLADSVRSLETRRGSLVEELAQIDARLSAISDAIAPLPGNGAAEKSGSSKRVNAIAQRAGLRERRSWFERDEATRLLKQAAKMPVAQAALIREIAKTKGYARKLSEPEMKRFQSAAYMAIYKALKDKALRRTAGGKVVAA